MCVVYYGRLGVKSKVLEEELPKWVEMNWHGKREGQGLNRSGHV